MNCNFVEEHMLDLAAGNAASSEVTKHLNACTGCATKLDEFRSTMALLDEWQAPEPSPYFDTRLKARLREAAAEPVGFRAWVKRPGLAGALARLMAVGGVVLGPVDEGQLSWGSGAQQVFAGQDLQS